MTNESAKALVCVGLFFLISGLLVVGPLFTIWAVNEVAGTSIPFTFKTWAAVAWLIAMIHGIKISIRRNS